MIEGFFHNLLKFILDILFYIASIVLNIIAIPFMTALSPLIPNLSTYLGTFNTFCDTYLFRGLAFCREVFLNVTGYPRALFYVLITFFLAKLSLHLFIVAFKFLRNIIRIVTLHFDSKAG